jgi:hypothetical protein
MNWNPFQFRILPACRQKSLWQDHPQNSSKLSKTLNVRINSESQSTLTEFVAQYRCTGEYCISPRFLGLGIGWSPGRFPSEETVPGTHCLGWSSNLLIEGKMSRSWGHWKILLRSRPLDSLVTTPTKTLGLSQRCGEKTKLLPLLGIDSLFLGHPTLSLVTKPSKPRQRA